MDALVLEAHEQRLRMVPGYRWVAGFQAGMGFDRSPRFDRPAAGRHGLPWMLEPAHLVLGHRPSASRPPGFEQSLVVGI